MTVHYLYLAVSLLLLWVPRNWLRLGLRVTPKPERVYNAAKVERDPLDRTPKPLTEAGKSRNWVDLFRASIGTACISLVAINPSTEVVGVDHFALGVQMAILFVSICIQMVRFEGRFSLFAPIFFIQGISFGTAGFLPALFSTLISWGLSPVLPSAGAILFVHGACVLCFGLLLQDATPAILFYVAGMTWFPVIFAVLIQKRLPGVMDKRLKVVQRTEHTSRRQKAAD